MENPRKYGKPPFNVALVHGGPGAAGEMAPVAGVLSESVGVLEPLQTALSLDGQVAELRDLLSGTGGPPKTVVGFSWGAWLALILAARYPELVKKLVLIGCGPFEEKYAHTVSEARFARLSAAGREEVGGLIKIVEGEAEPGRAEALERLGVLLSRADAYAPEPDYDRASPPLRPDPDIFRKVWKDASQFRRDGGLIACAKLLKCPVTAIHGAHDPHPAEGVRGPLTPVVRDLKFVLLKDCGHKPWIEKTAKRAFYRILKKEIRQDGR